MAVRGTVRGGRSQKGPVLSKRVSTRRSQLVLRRRRARGVQSPSVNAFSASIPAALSACTNEAQCWEDLASVFEQHVAPVVRAVLHLPIAIATSTKSLVASVSEDVCAAAVQFADYPDAWYLAVTTVWDVLQQFRHQHTFELTRTALLDGADAATAVETVVVNTAIFLHVVSSKVLAKPVEAASRRMQADAPLSFYWPFVEAEATRMEQSTAFMTASAAERRSRRRDTVLAVCAPAQRRALYSRCWTEILSYPTRNADVTIQLLALVTADILPHLTNPLLLADWFLRQFTAGSIISVLALRGLFTLMVQHGLEQPQFYDHLYKLLTPETFASRHRAEFFRLLDVCLSSVRLPSSLVSAFAKKILRAACLAPAPTLYFVLPLVRRLLQEHPVVQRLIHRVGVETGIDPFNAAVPPQHSHADASSLYEIGYVVAHFLPACAPMVNAVAAPAVDRAPLNYNKTYSRLITAAATRRGVAEVAPRHPAFDVLRGGVLRL